MTHKIPNRNSNLLLISLFVITTLFFAVPPQTKGQTQYKHDYQFAATPLATLIEEIVKPQCVSVVVDETAKDFVNNTTVDFQLLNATSVDALRLLFKTENLNYDYTEKTIVVYKGPKPKQDKRLLRIMYFDKLDLGTVINQIAGTANLKAKFDESSDLTKKSITISFQSSDTSTQRALQSMLESQGLTYEYTSCDEILILQKTAVVPTDSPKQTEK